VKFPHTLGNAFKALGGLAKSRKESHFQHSKFLKHTCRVCKCTYLFLC
jgi:hypothetical protein